MQLLGNRDSFAARGTHQRMPYTRAARRIRDTKIWKASLRQIILWSKERIGQQ